MAENFEFIQLLLHRDAADPKTAKKDAIQEIEKCLETARIVGSDKPWGICRECLTLLACTPGLNLSIGHRFTAQRCITLEHLCRVSLETGCSICSRLLKNIQDQLHVKLDPLNPHVKKSLKQLPLWARHIATSDTLATWLVWLQNRSFLNGFSRLISETSSDLGSLRVSIRFRDVQADSRFIMTLHVPYCNSRGESTLYPINNGVTLTYVIYPSSDTDISAQHLSTRTENIDVGGPAAMQTARSWLDQCRSSCTRCVLSPEERILPGRLIYLGIQNSDLTDLRLIDPTKYGVDEYVALSYCWGQPKQPEATLEGNVQERYVGFSSSRQPRTIRDAIFVSISLGVPYLWVDSLCIVQDSESDISVELVKIRPIFEGAIFTICAGSAEFVTDGFLQKRDNFVKDKILDLPLWDKESRVGRIFLLQSINDYYAANRLAGVKPLHLRAWTLEEWILSPRRLVFGSAQLQWKCRGFEKQDGGDPGNFGHLPGDWDVPEKHSGINRDRKSEPSDWRIYWCRLLNQYTTRHLTYDRDRLIALEGVIQRLEKNFDLSCTYGIWHQDIVFSLCWAVRFFSLGHRIKSTDYPTWSWANLDARVELKNSFPWDKYLAFECQIIGNNSTEPGCLKMKAGLLRIKSYPPWPHRAREPPTMVLEVGEAGAPTLDSTKVKCHMFPDVIEFYRTPPERIRLVPLIDGQYLARGLLVVQVEHDDVQLWERIGFFSAYDWGWKNISSLDGGKLENSQSAQKMLRLCHSLSLKQLVIR